ncbi:MAG: response regulator [Candidatus Eremiobacteraeota bacterium]|nr:response regulator [Candidatus Eremiobacteraeota bacterium]
MPASILVVDDNAENLELMLYLLRAFGYGAMGCSDARSGLEAARADRYRLVLCDILMPGMDGYEFARRFKADPSVSHTPLVAVTALAMPADAHRIRTAGFDGYIKKPIEPQTFVAQIAAFLRPASA